MGPPKILLEGRPGAGKTTVAERTVELLRAARIPLAGFVTAELRERGRRVGFCVESVGGERAVLAHVDLPGPPRVGKYGVDLRAFEGVALPALTGAAPRGVTVIDELGKMELASEKFRQAVSDLLERDSALLATVHVFRHPFTDALKGHPGVETLRVDAGNRERLPELLAKRLSIACIAGREACPLD